MTKNPEEHRPHERPDRPGFGNPENWDTSIHPHRFSSKIPRSGHQGSVDHRLTTVLRQMEFADPIAYRNRSIVKHDLELAIVSGLAGMAKCRDACVRS